MARRNQVRRTISSRRDNDTRWLRAVERWLGALAHLSPKSEQERREDSNLNKRPNTNIVSSITQRSHRHNYTHDTMVNCMGNEYDLYIPGSLWDLLSTRPGGQNEKERQIIKIVDHVVATSCGLMAVLTNIPHIIPRNSHAF